MRSVVGISGLQAGEDVKEWYWTGSLAAFARACRLRIDPHAQEETRIVMQSIARHMADLFPVSWDALMDEAFTDRP